MNESKWNFTIYYTKVNTFISFALLISCQEENALEESSQMGYVEFTTSFPSGSEASNGKINNSATDKLSHIVISIQKLKGDYLIET